MKLFNSSLECEHLIRHMLVRDVAKRYTMVQIMNHKWINEMDEEDKASALLTDTLRDSDFSEEVLTMMLARGIDREKTIQVLILLLIIVFDSSWCKYDAVEDSNVLEGGGGAQFSRGVKWFSHL